MHRCAKCGGSDARRIARELVFANVPALKAPGAEVVTHEDRDAIIAPNPGELTVPILHRHCHLGIVKSENRALQAMSLAFKHPKRVAEPKSAVAPFHADEIEANTVSRTLSGGNVDAKVVIRACNVIVLTEPPLQQSHFVCSADIACFRRQLTNDRLRKVDGKWLAP